MASTTYRCKACGVDLNLNAEHLFPTDCYFEAGNKNSASFSWVDDSKLKFQKEDAIMPFFETINYWGIQRNRTKILCDACDLLLGHVYTDGPSLVDGSGQFRMGPSQVVPRTPRYRFKMKALQISNAPSF